MLLGPALHTGRQAAARVTAAVRDAVLPPTCLACGAVTSEAGRLCADCWGATRFLDGPGCPACGFPFPHAMPDGMLCTSCVDHPPHYRRARAALHYDDATRPLILRFKYGDGVEGARSYGAWMARAGAALVADADVIAPVPLHFLRLLGRRYNQAALLAQGVSAASGKPVWPDLLVRTRHTSQQKGLDRKARRRNVKGAFVIKPAWADALRGNSVLLVDDVMTSGATVDACTDVLLNGGAAAVDVLTLARAGRLD